MWRLCNGSRGLPLLFTGVFLTLHLSAQNLTSNSVTDQNPQASLPNSITNLPATFDGAGWKPLLDGKSLAGWKVTDFAGHSTVSVEKGSLVADAGSRLTGITYGREVPTMDYEIALDAMKLEGKDFFCGLTFPVGTTNCTLILGGWGGSITGLSSLDELDASENETGSNMTFETGRWYRVRVKVAKGRIEAWVDNDKVADVRTEGRKLSLRRGEIGKSAPLGIASFQTRAAWREIRVRQLPSQSPPAK